MRHWQKTSLVLVAFAVISGLALAGLWACSRGAADDIEDDRYENLRKLVFELGAIRLAIVPEDISYSRGELSWQGGNPPQFLFFDRRQRIGQAGFEPVWRNDRYILRDMISQQEIDPFNPYPGKKLNSRKEIDDDEYLRQLFSMLDLNDLLFYTYYRQLNGFHLVLRPGGSSGDKFLFVKNTQEKDVQITLEQLMTLDDTITFNCSYEWRKGAESETHLKEQGFIMKKRGDGHIPVSLETGEMAELPPKQIFVDDALRKINDDARKHGGPLPLMGQRHVEYSRQGYINRPYYVEKVLLELYGLEIRWNETERRYEIVQ